MTSGRFLWNSDTITVFLFSSLVFDLKIQIMIPAKLVSRSLHTLVEQYDASIQQLLYKTYDKQASTFEINTYYCT